MAKCGIILLALMSSAYAASVVDLDLNVVVDGLSDSDSDPAPEPAPDTSSNSFIEHLVLAAVDNAKSCQTAATDVSSRCSDTTSQTCSEAINSCTTSCLPATWIQCVPGETKQNYSSTPITSITCAQAVISKIAACATDTDSSICNDAASFCSNKCPFSVSNLCPKN